ncbi:MAG: DNA polymerase III subunit gamma/tau, partial [Methylococcales bacterium]|nr:DNA polymerase III subunit gamma/tau [Methylococcales bacterium]
ALTNALDQNRIHHAFLFTGTRGVGKTTLARIFSKSLNCEQGPTSTPCGQCSACQEIDDGRFIDLIEVDAASRTKVDETRELMDNVQYAPTQGRYKVYLIDEVHMFSNHSFNALLKTLEEPPEHVKFLLATTDPQKLPITILSRCLQFNLKRLTAEQIKAQFENILDQESVAYETEALTILSHAADGSMRDGLSLLDQSISFGAGQVRENDVRTLLETVDQSYVIKMLVTLANHDADGLLTLTREIAQYSPNYPKIIEEIALLFHKIALYQVIESSLPDTEKYRNEIIDLAQLLTKEDVQLYYQIAISGKAELELSPSFQTGFEMILLRMLAFKPFNLENIADSNQSKPQSSVKPDSIKPAPTKPVQSQTIANNVNTSPPPAIKKTVPPLQSTMPSDKSVDIRNWSEFIKQLQIGGLTRELANNCYCQSIDTEQITLNLDPKHAQLKSSKIEIALIDAISTLLAKPMKINIEIAKSADETPAQENQRKKRQRMDEVKNIIENDVHVKSMQEVFDAKIVPNSIKPID